MVVAAGTPGARGICAVLAWRVGESVVVLRGGNKGTVRPGRRRVASMKYLGDRRHRGGRRSAFHCQR